MKRVSLLMAVIAFFAQLVAQPDMSSITLADNIYVSGVESVSLLPYGVHFGEPMMILGAGNGQLHLAFDDLEEESRYLKYTIIHCTHDWQPSDMNQIEYIDGFMEDDITTYNYSFNTITHYIHYDLFFPNERLMPTKSGNYILFVYDDTPDNPVLTRRFMIREDESAGITATVHQSSNVEDHLTRQEVDFVVNAGNYPVRNPAMTLHATIKQNGRWDNAIYGLTYRSGRPGEFSFDYDNGINTFDGGAEFHTFDIRSLRTNGDRVIGLTFERRENQAYILEDEARPFGAYESRQTLNGACIYRNTDMQNPYSEDYVNTHFTLKSSFPFTDGDVYVFGQLTDWRIQERAKLKYNERFRYWEAAFPIKQGVYNYQYVYVPHDKSRIDATYIEGNHYETQNQYQILLYFREEGTSYDKLIGATNVKM